MRSWNRWAAVLYVVAGSLFLYTGVRGPGVRVPQIALGGIFIALGVWRFQRQRRADAAAAPPGGPPPA